MKSLWKSLNSFFKSSMSRESDEGRKPLILPRQEHCISRKNIDQDALKVLYRLKKFGHTAYLVGGGVRDLLLGLPAKDFDISTSARPGQIKKAFNNCRLIGRRFRLAHIYFKGGKIIEVATFRKQSEFDRDDLLIKTDNTYGTAEEDAFRRDFTVNGLFYNIADFSVIDYVGGLQDLKNRTIRCIGDPDIRLREDPIRMLRAIKLAARLDFEIDGQTLEAINSHRSEIWKGATPRILEEIYRILREESSRKAMNMLLETKLMDVLMPELEFALARRGLAPALWRHLDGVDNLIKRGKNFSLSVLYANLMSQLFRSKVEHTKGPTNIVDLAEESLYPIAKRLGMPKRIIDRSKSITLAQRHFQNLNRKGFRPGSFIGKPYFSEALDLFQIHSYANPDHRSLFHNWQKLASTPGKSRKPGRTAPPRRRNPRSRGRGRRPGEGAT